MLKLDQSAWRVKNAPFFSLESPTFFLCSFLLLSRRETILFPWKVDDLLPKLKRKVALFSVHYDLFFLLDSQVVRSFCPKECFTTPRVVMRVTYARLSSERSSECLFKEVNQPGETMSRRYITYPVGDACLDLICK